MDQRIQKALMRRYDAPVMNNVYRADYVECLVALALGTDWELTWETGWEWAAWDCQHTSGARLEIKHSSARQPWDREIIAPPRSPRFDTAPRTGYWTQNGSQWVDSPGRPADLYVFAWHGERREGYADQRDANQWVFFVVAERDLPKNRKSIGLKELESISAPCRIKDLEPIVENTCPAPEALKAVRGGHSL